MKDITNKINEGFFDNVGGINMDILNDFIKRECVIVKKNGKEYILRNGNIFDVEDLKNTYIELLGGGKSRVPNQFTEIKIDRTFFRGGDRYIEIDVSRKSISGRWYRSSYKFDTIWGDSDKILDKKDELLKAFIES